MVIQHLGCGSQGRDRYPLKSSFNSMTRYYSQHPSLHLKGNWLEEAGFATGQAVQVRVERGQLVIQVVTED
ncbi:SymE family type I addiction module toxin [Photorhabdus sp. CRCIA-P01]|uniref:SymE family type I addiction module toxin n=1 Tax=Photorhabdus sp. CRCIA-P01 TaxID=2019570 RepID=UPI000E59B933|nr:SymE family type I addiction module toxin [Photorhabdus sp. CRCIA-P01]